jgi:hypothetical protein
MATGPAFATCYRRVFSQPGPGRSPSPESLFIMPGIGVHDAQNRRSSSPRIPVQHPSESAFTIARNMQVLLKFVQIDDVVASDVENRHGYSLRFKSSGLHVREAHRPRCPCEWRPSLLVPSKSLDQLNLTRVMNRVARGQLLSPADLIVSAHAPHNRPRDLEARPITCRRPWHHRLRAHTADGARHRTANVH